MCSCNVRRTGYEIGDSHCWHIACLRKDVETVSKIESMIEFGFKDNHSLYFGDTLTVLETGANG